MIIATTLLITCVKLLLIPAYRSTDFDVHRNWLAITHSLPIDKWYLDETSEWTLDYPPFFAWFEYILSFFATYFDSNMLKVENINYDSDRTILFQRLSVITTDLVYVYGVYKVCETLPASWKKDVVLPLLLLTNCGLIMLDHIHFQYNGMLYGIMLLSIAFILQEKYKWSSFWFAFLINMKHIYIYLAPAYLIFLLRHYCMRDKPGLKTLFSSLTLKRVFELGSIVIGVTAVSFLPFAHQLEQVLGRLFPFKRGLCHAYWAPNFWALYNFMDKLASIFLTRLAIIPPIISTGSMTRGLVQEFSHAVLPSVTPLATLVLTVFFMIPCLMKLFFMNKNPLNFLRCMVLCGLTSFMFGWHVHEKAILMAILPMSFITENSGLATGDTLILQELSTASKTPNNKPTAASETEATTKESDELPGLLLKQVVPADNSCLFTSIHFVLNGKIDDSGEAAPSLRKLVAELIRNDKVNFDEAILGKSVDQYCTWIQNDSSWGGAIELAILSNYYGIEIAVVDTTNAIVNRFGEDQNYPVRVLLMFDGIHYDPLYLEPADGGKIQTMFESSDDRILCEAKTLAQEAKSSRQFTDVNKFTLKCLVCNIMMKGQTEAQSHAQQTGHANFGEV